MKNTSKSDQDKRKELAIRFIAEANKAKKELGIRVLSLQVKGK